jgi:hypothetical protein
MVGAVVVLGSKTHLVLAIPPIDLTTNVIPPMSLCPTSSPDVTPPDRLSSKRNTSLPKVVHTPLKGGAQGAPTEGTTKRRASAGDDEEVSLSFPYVPTPSIHLSIRSSVVAITRIRAHAHSCLTHTRTPARTHTHTHTHARAHTHTHDFHAHARGHHLGIESPWRLRLWLHWRL